MQTGVTPLITPDRDQPGQSRPLHLNKYKSAEKIGAQAPQNQGSSSPCCAPRWGSRAAGRWWLMHRSLVEVVGGGSLEVFPQASPAPPCVSALLGQDDPYCKPSVLSVCPVYSTAPHRTARVCFWPRAFASNTWQTPPSAPVVWGHCFHEEDTFGKDAILLRLLAKFPVECAFSSFSRAVKHPGAQPVSCPAAGGSGYHGDVPRCPAPAGITGGTWGFRMCLGNQFHQLGWMFDLVSYLGLISNLFKDDEIGVGFSGVAVVNKNVSHFFVPRERKRK